jgi:hypothetical protein
MTKAKTASFEADPTAQNEAVTSAAVRMSYIGNVF